MKRLKLTLLSSIILIASAVAGLMAQSTKPKPDGSEASAPVNQERGQQVFAQNCSRCHNAPEGFSPRISGTIARHMRVRASLSEADYKALLKFLNP